MAVTFSGDPKGLMHINKHGLKNDTLTKSKYPSVGTLLSKKGFSERVFFLKSTQMVLKLSWKDIFQK